MEVNVCNSVHPKFCMFIPVRPYCHHPEHQIIWSWLIGNWGRASLTNRYSTNNLLWFVACTTCRSENWWILLTFHLHVMGCLVPQQISKCPPLLHLESSLSCCPLDISWSLSSQETFTRSELSVICPQAASSCLCHCWQQPPVPICVLVSRVHCQFPRYSNLNVVLL